jgi:hypothetical protein
MRRIRILAQALVANLMAALGQAASVGVLIAEAARKRALASPPSTGLAARCQFKAASSVGWVIAPVRPIPA